MKSGSEADDDFVYIGLDKDGVMRAVNNSDPTEEKWEEFGLTVERVPFSDALRRFKNEIFAELQAKRKRLVN